LTAATTSTDDHGYAAYMSAIDVLVMGRITFEKVLTFGEWPYDGMRVVVLSTTMRVGDIPESLRGKVEIHAGSVEALVHFLADSGSTSIYVDGGKVIQSFLRAKLIDEMTITRIPILLGSGIALFGKCEADITLTHLNTRTFNSGFVQSTYQVVR
jgi:dihydrofolate reductase